METFQKMNHFSAICEKLVLFSSWSLPRLNPKLIKCNPSDLDFVDFRLFQCSFGRGKVCLRRISISHCHNLHRMIKYLSELV